jgi:hypothetical protein
MVEEVRITKESGSSGSTAQGALRGVDLIVAVTSTTRVGDVPRFG